MAGEENTRLEAIEDEEVETAEGVAGLVGSRVSRTRPVLGVRA